MAQSNLQSRIWVLICALLLMGVPGFGQQCDMDRAVRAKALLAGFFPELKQHALYVSVYDGIGFNLQEGFLNFSMVLEPMPIDSNPQGLKESGWPQISHFTFRKDSLLEEWSFSADATDVRMRGTFGSFDVSQKTRVAINEVDAHREWSDADIENALIRAGAKAPPGSGREALKNIDVTALKLIFPQFRVKSNEFFYRDEYKFKEGQPSAELNWRIVFVTHLRGQDLEYVAIVDPFSGKPYWVSLASHVE